MISRDKLTSLVGRAQQLSEQVTEAAGTQEYAVLAKEFSDLEPIAAASQVLLDSLDEKISLEEMIAAPEEDKTFTAMAAQELRELEDKIEAENQALQIALLPRDSADERNVIIEIRAGTGGDEAGLFAGDLYRMYVRHAQNNRWKVDVMLENEGAVGGYKEIALSVSGKEVYGRLKFESGVHRVQRVPETESGGRVHTSAATVVVMPEAEDIDVEIEEKDLKIDVFRASGAGGQHVNKTDSAVRVTHLPTGIVVVQQDNRSQHRNRDTAMKILRSRLFEAKRMEQEQSRASERRSLVGSGDRSERIRTYNFPQGRISDHRINLTLYKLEQILMGEGLDEIIDALISDHQAQLLAASNEDLG